MPDFEFQVIRLPRWLVVLAVSLVLALALALAVVAAGLFLIIFPVVVVLAAILTGIGMLRGRRAARRQVQVIDADYIVHEEPFGYDDRRRDGRDRGR